MLLPERPAGYLCAVSASLDRHTCISDEPLRMSFIWHCLLEGRCDWLVVAYSKVSISSRGLPPLRIHPSSTPSSLPIRSLLITAAGPYISAVLRLQVGQSSTIARSSVTLWSMLQSSSSSLRFTGGDKKSVDQNGVILVAGPANPGPRTFDVLWCLRLCSSHVREPIL